MKKELSGFNRLVKKDLSWVKKIKPAKNWWVISVFCLLWLAGFCFVFISFRLAAYSPTQEFAATPDAAAQRNQPIPQQAFLNQSDLSASPQKIQTEQNILLAGVPGAGNSAPNLTDTLMLAHVNPDDSLLLISFPRDLLVQPPNLGYYTKINGVFGLFLDRLGPDRAAEKLMAESATISGLAVEKYLIVDLGTLREVVDFVGGVDISNTQAIYDDCFPGPDFSCQKYYLSPGPHHLNGTEVLKYVRSRHSTYGDFDRIARQQEVLLALKEKVAGQNLLENFSLFTAIGATFFQKTTTNLSLSDCWQLWQTIKETGKIKTITISHKDEPALLQSGQFQFSGGQVGYVLMPKAGLGNYSEVRQFIAEIISGQQSTVVGSQ